MTEFRMVPLGDIIVPERLRLVEEDHALAIQASIVEHGLINPITVRRTPPATKPFRPFTLIAGAHRLRAVALLGDDAEIEAMVVETDKDEAQLVEITENLFRNELSALDRAMAVMSYREVWERKFGKIEPGRPRKRINLIQLIEDEAAAGFSVHVAERLGISVPAVKRSAQIALRLSPDLRKRLRGTPVADNQSQLLSLARMEPERQRKIAKALEETQDVAAAIAATDDAAAARGRRPMADKRTDTVLTNYGALGEAARHAALRELFARFPADLDWAIENLRGGEA